MKLQTQSGLAVVFAALLFVATVQAQSQDPKVWIQQGDAAWQRGNTVAALENYNYALRVIGWDWSSALTLTQRYLALGQERQALNAYGVATNLAWNWATDANTLRLRPNGRDVTMGEQGLTAAVNLWNNTLKSTRMSDYTRQAFQQAAQQTYDAYQQLQRMKTGITTPPAGGGSGGNNLSGGEDNIVLTGTTLSFGSRPTAGLCQADCANNPNCKGFTWIQAGTYKAGDPAMCYLLSAVTGRNPARGHYSAVKGNIGGGGGGGGNTGARCGGAATQEITATPSVARPGETITVRFAFPGNKPDNRDWVSLFHANGEDRQWQQKWKWAWEVPTCEMTFTAPAAGQYEFRYLWEDPSTGLPRVLARTSLTVR